MQVSVHVAHCTVVAPGAPLKGLCPPTCEPTCAPVDGLRESSTAVQAAPGTPVDGRLNHPGHPGHPIFPSLRESSTAAAKEAVVNKANIMTFSIDPCFWISEQIVIFEWNGG